LIQCDERAKAASLLKAQSGSSLVLLLSSILGRAGEKTWGILFCHFAHGEQGGNAKNTVAAVLSIETGLRRLKLRIDGGVPGVG